MGQGSRWAFVIYPQTESKCEKVQDGLLLFTLDRVNLAVNNKKKQRVGSKWTKGQDGFLLFSA